MLDEIIDNPTASANHMVFGMDKKQRDEANRINNNQSSVPTWV